MLHYSPKIKDVLTALLVPAQLKAQLHGSGSTRATKWYGSRDAHIWARAHDEITYNVHTDDVYLANQIHVLKSAGTFQKTGASVQLRL